MANVKTIKEKLGNLIGVEGTEEMDVQRILYLSEDGGPVFTMEAVKMIINHHEAFKGRSVYITPPHADEFRTPDTWVAEATVSENNMVIRNASARRTLSAATAEEGIDPYTGCQNAALAALVRNMGIYPPMFSPDEKDVIKNILSGIDVSDTDTINTTEPSATKEPAVNTDTTASVEAPRKKRGRPAAKPTEEPKTETPTEVQEQEPVVKEAVQETVTSEPADEPIAVPVETSEVSEDDLDLVLKAPARLANLTIREALEKAKSSDAIKAVLSAMTQSADFNERFPREAKAIKSFLE